MTASNSKAGHTVRVKSANVNTREYDEAQMHKRFADVSAAIHARPEKELGFNSVDVTPRSLSLLAGNLRQFVESALGRKADPGFKKITKFPHKLFLDYEPGGALDIMLCACLNFKALHGLRRLEFANIDKREFYYDLLLRIEKSLKQARLLPMVRVFFARSVPTSIQPELRAIVQKRGVTVSTAAAATHIVYPDPEGSTAAETDGTDYCRPLELKDAFALVHWWYYPDSYDSWIPREDVDGVPDPPEHHEGAWHVQIRWLQDTDLFNEWMNEIDYEVPEEMRMKVIPAPRAEDSPANVKVKSAKTESDKASKKRRRMSTSSSSKHPADSTSERDARNNLLGRAGKMNLANLTDDSEEETIRKPKRHSDGHRRGKDFSSNARSRKESSDGQHARKKARMSEEGRGGKGEVIGSIKVRLNLKAPHERSKNRPRDRAKESRGFESGRHDRREASADSKALKIRAKLGKLGEAEAEGKVSVKDTPRESDNDDASSARSKAPVTPSVKTTNAAKVDPAEVGKESGTKSDSGAATLKAPQRQSGNEEAPIEEGAQEQKRPFSRRRSKKKERRQQNRMPGVTMVDDAIPIPEGEVPRIRNISNEGTDMAMAMNMTGSNREKEALSSSEVEEEVIDGKGEILSHGKSRLEKMKVSAGAGGSAMDVDAGSGNGRIMVISERMLSGDGANAPVSGADVVEALPPVTVRVPAHARWFRMDAIHDIEKRSLSEFFNSRGESKTPMVYKKYRDFMIDVWRQAPEKYLTATAARRHLAGDVCAILRVHAFLEHWGLINYGTEPESKPHLSSSLRPRNSRPRPMHLDSVVPEQLNGVPRLLFFDEPRPPRRENAPVTVQKAVRAAKEKSRTERNLVLSRRELYATAAATKYECDACGCDCSRMRYHCVGNADMELCPSCFANGKYPGTLSARDFEQLTTVLSSEAYDGTVWSEAEVLLLLEALEKYGDDWNQVAEHVGTKNNEQCVLQFLRMPLEDSFLEDQVGNWAPGGDAVEDVNVLQESASGEHKFAGPLLPFHDTANPVMAQIAFLASSVDPEVAAAAAQAALNKIMADSGQKPSAVKEEKSVQAKALLKSQNNASEPVTENGIGGQQASANGSNLNTLPGTQLDALAVEAAGAVGLAAAVGRARHLFETETREIEREFAVVVETKMRAVDLKMKEIERLDLHMRRERERLERQRQQVFAERVDASLMRITNERQSRSSASQPPESTNAGNAGPVPHMFAGPQAAAAMTAVGTNAGQVQLGSLPVQHRSVQLQQGLLPMQQRAIPMQQSGLAVQQGSLPLQRGSVPVLQGALPMQQSSAPTQQSSVPILHGAVTMQQGTVPIQQGGVQMAQGALPMQQSALQMQQGGMPMPQGGVTMQQGAMQIPQGALQTQQSAMGLQPSHVGLQSGPVPVQPRPVPVQPGPRPVQPGGQQSGVAMQSDVPMDK